MASDTSNLPSSHTSRHAVMEPLSIASGILAVLTASGHTLQGLEKVWSLHHRSQEFVGLWNQANGVRALLWGTEIALRHIRDDAKGTPRIQDCLENIDKLAIQANEVNALLNKTIQEITPRNGRSSSKKPSKRSWLRRKSKIDQLTNQVSDLTVSLNAALSTLQGVQSSVTANQTALKIDLVLSKVEALVANPNETNQVPPPDVQIQNIINEAQAIEENRAPASPPPEVTNTVLSRRSSWQSFHSAVSSSSDSSGTLVSFSGSLSSDTECESFCSCQCHISTQSKLPWWTTQLIGCITIHGNGSMLLNRRPCNKKHCRKSGPARLQISYVAPAWTLLHAFNIYVKAETIAGPVPTVNMFMPRVISSGAPVWSIIELGNLDELRGMLSRNEASPYDVSVHGVSLLKHAATKGQNEIIAYLLTEKADPFFRDQSGMMAIQPGIDRVLSGSDLDRNASGKAQVSYEMFVNSEILDQQGFNILHLITLDLQCGDFEMALKHYSDIDTTDVNGRTPLLWAAWMGNVDNVVLLLRYGADVDKADNQNWTPLAKASQAGHLGIVQCLIEAGASLTIPTFVGFQPIHYASDNKINGARIVEELIDRGADPNAHSPAYGTPLHNAANRGSIATIKCLLAHGAQIDATDGDGDTPLLIALGCWNEPAFFHLAKSGARLDVVRNSGHGVMHAAIWFASTDVWDVLIKYAESGKFRNVHDGVRHGEHNILACFEKCRTLRFPRARNIESEKIMFHRLIRAFDTDSMLQSSPPD